LSKTARIVLFGISLVLVVIIFLTSTGRLFPVDPPSVVLISALVMLSFVTLFLEHFFTRPTDVLASTIAILLLLLPLEHELSKLGKWYWLFIAYNAFLLLTALIALLLVDKNEPSTSTTNKVSALLKSIAVFFGNGRFLFFALFLLVLFFYVDSQSNLFLILAVYSSVVLLVDPKEFVLSSWRSRRKGSLEIAEIFSVQSRNAFLAKLFPNTQVEKFDLVEFKHSEHTEQTRRGMIGDLFVLNEQQWIKVIATTGISESLNAAPFRALERANVVYKIENFPIPASLKRFVGVVLEDSNIMKVHFDYAGQLPIMEGNLLEVETSGKDILYQVTQGVTAVEPLEKKNEAGLVVGEAVQLGRWDPDRLVFEKHGWVPEMNSPLFLATNPPAFNPAPGEKQIGSIPGTSYPVLLNLKQAVTHHTAILGITGSGKSVFCRSLIRKIVADGMKVICVDFTNEYRDKFPDLEPGSIVPDDKKAQLFTAIDAISTELEKFANQQNKQLIAAQSEVLMDTFYDAVKAFLQSDKKLALFELPDVSNTTGILEYTKWFFKGLFQIARQDANFGKQVCVVLEEAHTVIPEWNFLGVDDRKAQSVVNSISQIALQGRKYNVGFIIVAQRTANVSKTVLTQCNSIIAFQQFDKTSSDFLENYMGSDLVGALPALRFRQAIAVGKAFRSGVPMIFEVPEIVEPVAANGA